jgi:DNA modification methylase
MSANRIEFGDCRDTMRRWAKNGVRTQTCVTSPPYFGLRDYGHAGQIGMEETPEKYIAAMIEVFRCVRDVLADDGTLWLNIGDSYANNSGAHGGRDDNQQGVGAKRTHANDGGDQQPRRAPIGLKHKDLVGIPWMLAFALRADGWYLRQDIIWHKPNPMPESVQDRCTKAHEYIFLLSKSQKYYFDNEAIKQPCSEDMQRRAAKGHTRGAGGKIDASRQDADTLRGEHAKAIDVSNGRNRRSVWTVATRPYKGAHFATFPADLIEPCILAGSRHGDVVLDPFMGSGTTAQVAVQHGRHYLGCELNPAYADLQRKRIDGTQMNLMSEKLEVQS